MRLWRKAPPCPPLSINSNCDDMPSADKLSLSDQNGIDLQVASGERNESLLISWLQDAEANSMVVIMIVMRFILMIV